MSWMTCPSSSIDTRLLDRGEVHLCLMPLIQPASVVERLEAFLSPDERERASRFHFDRDRRRFIVARGMLRELLGNYVGAPADALRFTYGPFGKPLLAASGGKPGLDFSISHSGDWALTGFSRGRGVGVDLEEVRAMDDYRDLSGSHFAPAEVKALLDLPEDQHIESFFACWTRKEAYVKSLGMGLALDLSTFVVSVEPCESMDIIPARQNAGPHHVCGMRPLQNFWGAVAIEATNAALEAPKMRKVHHSSLAT